MDFVDATQVLGNLGEFFGAIAVVVTLAYLTVQTRQSVKVAKQSAQSDILARGQALEFLLMENQELFEVLFKGLARESMTAMEAQRFTSICGQFLFHTQDSYNQYMAGLVDKEVWVSSASSVKAFFSQPGFPDWWEHGKQLLTPEFVDAIEREPAINMILYHPETQTWSRSDGGLLGRDAVLNDSKEDV